MKKQSAHKTRSIENRIYLALTRADESFEFGIKGGLEKIRQEVETIEYLVEVLNKSIPWNEVLNSNLEIEDKIKKIEVEFNRRRSLFDSLLGSASQSHTAEIRRLNSQLRELKFPPGELVRYSSIDAAHAALNKLKIYLHRLKEDLPHAEERDRKREEAKILNEIRRREIESARAKRHAQTKALAAAHANSARTLARSVRRSVMGVRLDCPYCESPLSNNSHVDHIYPLSKGGLSTVENMIEVCVDCNSTKGDMTLFQFVESRGLDWSSIAERLKSMKKRF